MSVLRIFVACSVGIALALLQIVYAFLPFSAVLVILTYLALGWWMAGPRLGAEPKLLWIAVVPPWALTFSFVVLAGSDLLRGIGTLHLLNSVLIPVSAWTAYVFRRKVRRASTA